MSSEQGVPVVFLIHPVFERKGGFDQYTLAPVRQNLAQHASASGLFVLDLLETYAAYIPGELAQPTAEGLDPWHPNEMGHRLAAEALLDYIHRAPQLRPSG